MSAAEIIDQIKCLPTEDRWKVFWFLSQELESSASTRLFDEFSLIGSDAEVADIKFSEAAQAEVLRH